jgi:hypothetical protein
MVWRCLDVTPRGVKNIQPRADWAALAALALLDLAGDKILA